MNYKYKALFKYEFKKLVWFYAALVLFLIFYSSIHNNNVTYEVNNLLQCSSISIYYNFAILEPTFYFFYMVFVFVLVYLQFKDGFNKLWHSLPFTNKDVITVKLVTGVVSLFMLFMAQAVIMAVTYFNYKQVYIDILTVLNINPDVISIFFIFKALLIIFAVYVFVYFFTVFIQYIVGNCFSGILLSTLLIHMPTFVLFSAESEALYSPTDTVKNFMFLVFTHFYDMTNNIYDKRYNENLLQNLNIYINQGIFIKFSTASLIYYTVLALILLLFVYKISTSPKWIEQSNAFNNKWISYLFKFAFTLDFALIGYTASYSNFTAKIIISLVLAAIGYLTSIVIIKRQGVSL